MIGSGAGAQRTGVKRKAEDQTHSKRAAGFSPSLQSSASPPHSSSSSLTPASSSQLAGPSGSGSGAEKKGRSSKSQSSHLDMEIESLLNQQSTKEQQSKKVQSNINLCVSASLVMGKDYILKIRWIVFCVGEQRDSRAAEHQHCKGAVNRGKVPFPWPCTGPRVLWPRDQRGVCSLWRHTSAMQQTTLPVSTFSFF